MAAANKVPDNLNYLSNISFRLTIEDAPNITWFCQAANVPGVSIEGIDVMTPHATVPFAGNKVSFEELSVRFIVDEHLSRFEAFGHAELATAVLGPDSGNKSKRGAVRQCNRFVLVLEGQDCQHRPEQFFLCHSMIGGHIA